MGDDIEILSPNSKKLSLRETEDIISYFKKYKPSFIINSAIAAIDSDPQLARARATGSRSPSCRQWARGACPCPDTSDRAPGEWGGRGP